MLSEGQLAKVLGSLSSWRAWIEITSESSEVNAARVALLMESVD